MRSLVLVFLVTLLPAAASAQGTRDCPHCPEMVSLPRGTFVMGAAPGEEERERVPQTLRGRSTPQVKVAVGHAFSMGKHEVTRAQFEAFVRATGHDAGTHCIALDVRGRWEPQPGLSWRDPGFPQTDQDPVVCVSWEDAVRVAHRNWDNVGDRAGYLGFRVVRTD